MYLDDQVPEQFTDWLELHERTVEPSEPLQSIIERIQRKAHASRDLSLKQRTFAREYAKTRNATQSAITAGYSAHTAEQIGYKLTKHPRVAELVRHEREQLRAIEEAAPVSAAQVYELQCSEFVHSQRRRLMAIIDCDILEVRDGLITTGRVPEHLREGVKVAELTKHGYKIVLHDKIKALESLLKITTITSNPRPPTVQT